MVLRSARRLLLLTAFSTLALPATAQLPEGFLHFEAPQSWRSPRAHRALLLGGAALLLTDRTTLRLFDNDRHLDPQQTVDTSYKAFNFLAEGTTLLVGLGVAQALAPPGRLRVSTRLALTSLASSTVATTSLKALIGKQRPDQSGEPHYRGPSFQYSSFPSGHTAAAMSVAHVFARQYPRQRWLWYGFVGMVAASRVSSNKHWLSDTAAGATVGLLAAEGTLAGGAPGLHFRF